jgi:predicted transcriptional regulator
MKRLLAKDVMNPEVMTARADMSVSELTAFLLDNEISGAPVEDQDGQLVGVVSITDIARASGEHGDFVRSRNNPDYFVRIWGEEADELPGFHVEEDSGLLVSQIMTPAIFAVAEDTPVADVARTMLDSHVHRVIVLRSGRAVGIVTTTDLLSVIAGEREPARRAAAAL